MWLKCLSVDSHFELRLFVTGTHFLAEHGNTVQEIEKDGYEIFFRVPLEMQDQKDVLHLATMGQAVTAFSKALAANLPDAAVVLGDRYEALSFAIACNGLGIPLIHLHGGEVTEGALDDGYRHCITKLSYLHFVAAETYRSRVLQLGESPDRVFNVGALGVDNIKKVPLLSREDLEKDLGISFAKNLIAVTYHPETSNSEKDQGQVQALLDALQGFLAKGETSIVFTRANADHGNEVIHKKIEHFVAGNKAQCLYVSSLGMRRYLSLMKAADVVAGNSSSGIIEAPALGTPTVNIGDRQKGREMAKSVFAAHGTASAIASALQKAIQYKLQNSQQSSEIYGDGNAGSKMLEILKRQVFQSYPKKSFYDCLEFVKKV
jgi:UDP-hydrolysing UDP-N-acetyl-D-glucosamine 2-epimerase